MDYTLKNTETVNIDTENVNVENVNANAIKLLQAQLEAITSQLESLVVDYNGFKESTSSSVTGINSTIGSTRDDVASIQSSINELDDNINTSKITANEASINSAHILSLKADSLVDLPGIEPQSIKTPSGEIDTLNAASLTSDNAAINSATINSLEVKDSLTVPDFTSNTLSSNDLETDTASIKDATIDKLTFNGVPLQCIDVKYSGWTNGYLHKLTVRANGILLFKLPNASLVVTPGNVSSNYDKLYAAYKTDDGYWNIYLNTDLECQLLVIGTSDFSISDSLVLKSSVRRNADSMGQPNDGENIKVAVLNKLPTVGQRNVIYVILGDCAYYCDGQYFYEMASKKKA